MAEYTISMQTAADRLSKAGFRIGFDKIRAGLISGQLPFGVAIPSADEEDDYMFIVYSYDLDEFMKSHGWQPK